MKIILITLKLLTKVTTSFQFSSKTERNFEQPHSKVRDYFKRLARDTSKWGGVIDPNVSAEIG